MKEINNYKKEVDFDSLTIPKIKEALDLAEKAACSLAELEQYESYWKAVSSERTIREESLLKGIEQGIEQGIKLGEIQTKLSIAREMKRKGVPSSIIAEYTGLPETDIVNL